MRDKNISMSDIGLANEIRSKINNIDCIRFNFTFNKKKKSLKQIREFTVKPILHDYEDDNYDKCLFFESHMQKMISLYSRIIHKDKSISDYKDNK